MMLLLVSASCMNPCICVSEVFPKTNQDWPQMILGSEYISRALDIRFCPWMRRVKKKLSFGLEASSKRKQISTFFSPTAIERVNLRELDLCQTDRNDSLVHSTLNSANLLRTSHDLPWQNLRGVSNSGWPHYFGGPSWQQIQNSYGSRKRSPSLKNQI